ncbi:Phage Mu protein F like protein [Nitrosomonas nitrosa]|uniref:Phage Mu protein F like protein n=1 Tax=Nitrosomonas nitrosa TaxID=52442 RepID=A0A1I4RBV0_9PROT|nr:phage minor head protein [Nitrosomonas nitrosa]SFM49768.1 Phage Mu protein F like protein [Nitrosomonas nitrosa]
MAAATDPSIRGVFRQPFKEQVDFFRKKLNLPTERYDDIRKSAHDRAFIVAGAAKADLLDDLRDATDKAIASGESIGKFRERFRDIVRRHGWHGWTGEGSKKGEAWRTRVIYQTNLSTSYAAGRMQQLNDPDLASRRPYWKYIHNDTVSHPRPLHVSWSGLVLRKDDPWWQAHFPPNGWGCRCRVTAVRPSEYKGDKAPDDGFVMKKDSQGNLHRVPKGIDLGFDYAPGANRATPYKDLIDRKLIRFPAQLGADMWQSLKPSLSLETSLQWANTLDDWLTSKQAGRTAIVGAIGPDILRWLADEKQALPQTAEVAVREGLIRGQKQARHLKAGDGLNEAEWRRLPSIIAEPDQVLWDVDKENLIYIANSDDVGIKLSVRFEFRSNKTNRTNMIVSGFRQSSKTLEERLRGKLYEVVK